MKNFILGLLALLLCSVSIPAEVIDSVMYNPARLGQYEKLKVSDKASFKGGVKVNTLTLQSAGTVTVNNAGDYQVSNADVKGTVNMPSTHFVAPSIKTQGGTAQFVQTGETSSIDTINSVLPRLKANILKMNAVTVNGASTSDYDGDNIKGLRLGGNDIPAPSVNCSGLNWFARIDQNSGQTYQVLGLGSCEGADQNCTQNPNQEKCCQGGQKWTGSKCECPSNKKWNGTSCGYEFVGEVKDVKVLANYYVNNSSDCTKLTEKRYYTGGSLPARSKGNTKDNCELHISYGSTYYSHINAGGNYKLYENYYYWEARYDSGYHQGKNLPKCSGSNYDALCNANCNNTSSSCSYKCVISETVPASSGQFWCKISGRKYYWCNNNAGTGKILTCKVKS